MIRRAFKILLGVAALLVLAVGIALAVIGAGDLPHYPPGKIGLEVEVTPERVERGRHTAQMLCVACHLDNDTASLAGKPMVDVPAETGIGEWSEDEFVRLVRFGVRPDATVIVYPMVPYPELTDGEARAIFAYLRTVPPIKNAVARPAPTLVAGADAGRAAYYKYGCNGCHGDSGVGSTISVRGRPTSRPTNSSSLTSAIPRSRSPV